MKICKTLGICMVPKNTEVKVDSYRKVKHDRSSFTETSNETARKVCLKAFAQAL